MTMGQIVTALPALQKLADEKLTLKTLYKVSNLLSKADREISFYNSERYKIVESLGNNLQDDKWQIPEENRAEFESRMSELLNLEVDAELTPVTVPTSEDLHMSYNDIKALEGFVILELVES